MPQDRYVGGLKTENIDGQSPRRLETREPPHLETLVGVCESQAGVLGTQSQTRDFPRATDGFQRAEQYQLFRLSPSHSRSCLFRSPNSLPSSVLLALFPMHLYIFIILKSMHKIMDLIVGFSQIIYHSWLSHTRTPVSSCSLAHWTLPHHISLLLSHTHRHTRARAHTVSNKHILSPFMAEENPIM